MRPLKQWWSVLTEPRTQPPGQRCPSGEVYMGAEGTVFGLKRQDMGGGIADPPASLGTPPMWMDQAKRPARDALVAGLTWGLRVEFLA